MRSLDRAQRLTLSILFLMLVGVTSSPTQEWSRFRGPAGAGVLDNQNLPSTWDVESGENIRWRTPIPGMGHSSPIVWGEKVFVTTAVSTADEELVLGDARVSLERELADEKPQTFDVLVLDAFASDAVPVHLLTREAFDVYWRHLVPDGILAVHVSAIHLDLEPVVRGLARLAGKQTVRIINDEDSNAVVAWSDWVLVTVNQRFMNSEDVARAASRRPWLPRTAVVWTDDHSNLLPLLRRAKK